MSGSTTPPAVNVPMTPGVEYKVCGFLPGLTVSVDARGVETWRDKSTGMLIVSTEPKSPYSDLADVQNFSYTVVNRGKMVFRSTGTLPSAFLRSLTTSPAVDFPAYSPDEQWAELDRVKKQHKWNTKDTGGFGRGYVSPLCDVLFNKQQDGGPGTVDAIKVLRDWVCLELETRPLSHFPRIAAGDSLSRRTVNDDGPLEWNHQRLNSLGANAFDYAHLYLCHAYALASIGDPIGVVMIAAIQSWAVMSAHPGLCTNWITQPRGQGWMLELSVWAKLLKLWPDRASQYAFQVGMTTQEVATKWLEMSNSEHWTRGVGDGDNHNSPNDAKELRGHVAFQEAIRLWGLACFVRSDMPQDLRQTAREMFDEEASYLCDCAMSDDGKMSRLIGTYRFESRQQAEEFAKTAPVVKSPWQAYELTKTFGPRVPGWYIREVPRVADTELLAAPLALLHSRDAEFVSRFVALESGADACYMLPIMVS